MIIHVARGGTTMQLAQSASRRVLLLALASGLLLAPNESRAEFPEAGVDAFDTTMSLVLNVPSIEELSNITIDLEGPAAAARSNPDESDPCTIQTELISLSLTGFDDKLGEIEVVLNPEQKSLGEVIADGAGCSFPASSSFEVFVQISVGTLGMDLINLQAITVAGTINSLPPLFDTYEHPVLPTSLVQVGTTGPILASIEGESNHSPVQEPSFSVKAGGPSGLDPAIVFDLGNPPGIGLTVAGLGLSATDDIDALSYGLDIIDTPDEDEGGEMSIAFSVDKDAVGGTNTGVNREATQVMGHEAEGDEFLSTFSGSNLEIVDEQGVTLDPGNDDGDDLDALTNEPTSYPDTDDDFDADRPIFFSLTPSSPSLAGFASDADSAATIFASRNGTVTVYANPAAIGLVKDDDLDALCLMKSGLPDSVEVRKGPAPPAIPAPGAASQFDVALFSLAKGSPTLTTLGAAPGDLFVTNFSSAHTPAAPAVFSTAAEIGLLDTDELNALKCLMSVAIIPIYADDPGGVAATDGAVLLNVGGNDAIAQPDSIYDESAYGVWSIINPGRDFHGPYLHPDSLLAVPNLLGFPLLDPLAVGFGAGVFDVCPLFHLHTRFCDDPINEDSLYEGHADPVPCVCGHGMFVPHRGPAIPIVAGYEPFTLALNMLQSFKSLREQFPELYRAATLHRISRAFLVSFLNSSQPSGFRESGGGLTAVAATSQVAPSGNDDAYIVIVTGMGRTKMDVTLTGADGLNVGPVLASIPVPEPSGLASGLAALASLAGLRRARRPRLDR
jgi:hypothetical protein